MYATTLAAAAAVLVAAGLAGCSDRNYDFTSAAVNSPSSSSHALADSVTRAAKLAGDLEQLTAVHPDDESLYDLKVLPLLHSELHVFGEEADETSGAAYVEADIASCLPLFAFVNAEVRQYDADYRLLTEHRFDSSLWGMFRTHREILMLDAGPEETTKQTYFWIFTRQTQ
ncbi:hypothetical protein [Mucisphaera sp.]|uniref:hypothetical protein n=1 Tax=Mucisphaera sp. TaxID=2913024 RepID=UPI003D132782